MKKQRHVYSYSPSGAIEAHAVVEHRRDWIVIHPRAQSIFTQLVPKSELDADRYYYTTPKRAVEAFIVKAEAALGRVLSTEDHDGWSTALREARKFLCQKKRSAASQEQDPHSPKEQGTRP